MIQTHPKLIFARTQPRGAEATT